MQPPVITGASQANPGTGPAAARPELLRALRRLVRGISALFWSLPLALLTCVEGAATDWLRPLGVFPPVITTGLLLYGICEAAHFQPQERVWQTVLERTRVVALINLGLAPFIFFWNRFPYEPFFIQMVNVLMITGLLFLACLNQFLQRLAAMLPDETLREETRFFTVVNLYLILCVIGLFVLLAWLPQISLPPWLDLLARLMEEGRRGMLLTILLLPLAMTMTLLWKTKEVVLTNVFGGAE